MLIKLPEYPCHIDRLIPIMFYEDLLKETKFISSSKIDGDSAYNDETEFNKLLKFVNQDYRKLSARLRLIEKFRRYIDDIYKINSSIMEESDYPAISTTSGIYCVHKQSFSDFNLSPLFLRSYYRLLYNQISFNKAKDLKDKERSQRDIEFSPPHYWQGGPELSGQDKTAQIQRYVEYESDRHMSGAPDWQRDFDLYGQDEILEDKEYSLSVKALDNLIKTKPLWDLKSAILCTSGFLRPIEYFEGTNINEDKLRKIDIDFIIENKFLLQMYIEAYEAHQVNYIKIINPDSYFEKLDITNYDPNVTREKIASDTAKVKPLEFMEWINKLKAPESIKPNTATYINKIKPAEYSTPELDLINLAIKEIWAQWDGTNHRQTQDQVIDWLQKNAHRVGLKDMKYNTAKRLDKVIRSPKVKGGGIVPQKNKI